MSERTPTAVDLYDTTLRDGTQGEEISFSFEDKLLIARRLDELGFAYIEGGYPGSNPRDQRFFQELKKAPLRQARLVAFGMTRRAGGAAAEDPMLRALLEAGTPTVCIVGKSWDLHVTEALRTELDANLEAVRDTVAYLKEAGREVVFDAEHFFDGMKHNATYAMAVLEAAAEGGADWLVPCDTNGGSLPWEIAEAVEAVVERFEIPVGIHTHNDAEVGVANALAAVGVGASQVQGTVGGIGERCGNANIVSLAANLGLKMGVETLPPEGMRRLTELTNFVMELANLAHPRHLPYVGESAFAHKGGMHVSGVRRNPVTYEHIDPDLVGNRRRVLVSDLAGRATVLEKLERYGIDVAPDDPRIAQVLERLKELEDQGYQYEGAEASFELLVKRTFGLFRPYFKLVSYRCVDERLHGHEVLTEATVRVEVDGRVEHTAAVGNGPVNALDHALRRALIQFYPGLETMRLIDYKVRVLTADEGTEATVRVLIESGAGHEHWGTVGVGTNIIDASYEALNDAMEYRLYRLHADGSQQASTA